MTTKKNLIQQSATKAAQKRINQTKKQIKNSKTVKTARVAVAGTLTIGLTAFLISNPEAYESFLSQDSTPETSQTSESSTSSALNPVENSSPSETNPNPLGESTTTSQTDATSSSANTTNTPLATEILNQLKVKGRATKTGYARTEFYNSWPTIDGCSLRQRILKRDLGTSAVISSEDNCTVLSGAFTEPYTGQYLEFHEKSEISSGLQIDHVVALSDAWQKGAQNLTKDERYNLATDPLNLLAVDAKTNQGKSDGDAATWLPTNKAFRCTYVARQISVKYKYHLWVAQAEKDTMQNILKTCPQEPAIGV